MYCSFLDCFQLLSLCASDRIVDSCDEYAHWISRTKDVHKARCSLCLSKQHERLRESPWKLMSEFLKFLEKILQFHYQKQVGTLKLSTIYVISFNSLTTQVTRIEGDFTFWLDFSLSQFAERKFGLSTRLSQKVKWFRWAKVWRAKAWYICRPKSSWTLV